MDHETAIRVGAAERYQLGELTGADRDAFEEHYFMCPQCAEDVRALAVFSANARAVFREETARPATSIVPFWAGSALRFSAAMNVVLVLGLGYMLLPVQPEQPHFVQQVTARGPSRGVGSSSAVAYSMSSVVVSFFPPDPSKSFPVIRYALKDESGAVRRTGTLPAPSQSDSGQFNLAFPTGGLKSGPYEVSIWGMDGAAETEIGKARFEIAGR
jgi:hypothetical protein